MDDRLAHGIKERLSIGEMIIRTANHEGERASACSGNTTGDRGVDEAEAFLDGC